MTPISQNCATQQVGFLPFLNRLHVERQIPERDDSDGSRRSIGPEWVVDQSTGWSAIDVISILPNGMGLIQTDGACPRQGQR